MLNLDTHILLRALPGDLTTHERRVLQEDREWGISAIVLWEIEKLHKRNRIPHGLDYASTRSLLMRIHIWPISIKVCSHLGDLDFESDPANELIAATSLAHDVPLVTRDARIRASKVIRCL